MLHHNGHHCVAQWCPLYGSTMTEKNDLSNSATRRRQGYGGQEATSDKMEKIVSLCKRRGFIFPGSEIYGGFANSWDYGPVGVELKNNIKQLWWERFVHQRDDMVGIDAALIMKPVVWEASGHLKNFSDPLIECKKCHNRFKPDQLEGIKQIENLPGEYPAGKNVHSGLGSGVSIVGEDNKRIFISENTKCPTCGQKFELSDKPKQFNLMFRTHIGPVESDENIVYFRPETAQGMFVQFKNVLDTSRKTVPFGIAQVGKAFRNEITPGNFIFRTREFEQMEIEYFIPVPKLTKTGISILKIGGSRCFPGLKMILVLN